MCLRFLLTSHFLLRYPHMRLKHALILTLVAGGLAAALLAIDLDRRMAALVAGDLTQAQVLAHAGTPYLLALGAVGVLNLAALLLLTFALSEERTRAILRQGQREPRKNPPVPETKVEASAPPAVVWTGGTVAAWRAEHAGPFLELWNRACAGLPQAGSKERAQFDKFLAAPEFDVESSAVALAPDGSVRGGVLVLRYPSFEDDGFWWLESPAVIAALLVDPERRRKGAGRALLQFAESMARRRRRPRIFAGGLENFPHLVPGIPEQDHALRVFFASLGYGEVRRTCHMEAEFEGYVVPQELVEREQSLKEKGFSFAAAQRDDGKEFETFLERSNLDRKPRRLEKFIAEPDRFYLARHDGRIVGFIHVSAKDEQSRSGINLIYFLRDYRGAGLGSVLLVKAHELWKAMAARGGTIWTYPEAAARFYPRAGFKTVQEWVCYGKDLAHSWNDSEFVKRWR